MCGRFALLLSPDLLARQFELPFSTELQPRYNIAPTQAVLNVRTAPESGERELVALHWGLIPSWSKDKSGSARMINARSETAAEKPSFRTALKKRRSIIPASGFFEWKAEGKVKIPHYISRADGAALAFAALWEYWKPRDNPDAESIVSCAILTREANEFMQPLHDRMPVLLKRENFAAWLDPELQDAERIQALIADCDPAPLVAHTVSRSVNNPKNDAPDCVASTESTH